MGVAPAKAEVSGLSGAPPDAASSCLPTAGSAVFSEWPIWKREVAPATGVEAGVGADNSLA